MTDVITSLRDVNPKLQTAFAGIGEPLRRAVSILDDAGSCRCDSSREALVTKALVDVMNAKLAYDECACLVGSLDDVEKSYTRRFETGKPAADDRQMELPGMETGNGEGTGNE